MSFTDVFTGRPVSPVNPRYEAIDLTEDISLVWPTEAAQSTQLLVDWMDVTPADADLSIALPDATLGGEGFAAIFTNLGADDYTLLDDEENVIQVIEPGESWLIWLKDNTTAAGDWGTLQIGSTTSEATASILAGLGLTVIGLTLNQSHPVWNITANYTIIPNQDRARLLKWTGGSGTVSVPSAAVLGDNWFTLFSNQGSAAVTIDPSGAQTIDGQATKSFAIGESAFIISDGSNLFTVGYGRSIAYVETYANIDVSGSANYVLSSAQFASNIIRIFGTLTGNIDLEVPAAVHEFILVNETTGAFTVTCKVNGQTGVVSQQGEAQLLYCNGTDVFAGNTVNSITTGFFDNGTVTAPSISFTADTDTGLFRFAANTLGVAAGGVLSARFNTAASAVNAVAFTPGATGTPCIISSYSGTDSNPDLTITTQGTGAILLDRAVTASSTLGVAGNFAVATNKFTVAAASGNTAVAGTLSATGDFAINTNKFTVAAASGNTAVAGTLGVTGAATMGATLGVTGDFAINTNKFTVVAASGNTAVAGTLAVTGAVTLTVPLPLSGGGTGQTSASAAINALVPSQTGNAGAVLTTNGTSVSWGAAKYVGEIFEFAGTSAPSLSLLCYGQAISRSTYSALFDVIGTTYGVGDGSTTFNLPDVRGRAAIGKDDMGGSAANRVTNAVSGITATTLGASGGNQNMQQHTHTQDAHGHTSNNDGRRLAFLQTSGSNVDPGSSPLNFGAVPGFTINDATATNQNTGSGSSQNMPPVIVFNVCIFAGV